MNNFIKAKSHWCIIIYILVLLITASDFRINDLSSKWKPNLVFGYFMVSATYASSLNVLEQYINNMRQSPPEFVEFTVMSQFHCTQAITTNLLP